MNSLALPAWPTSIPRVFRPIGQIKLAGLNGYTDSDRIAILAARDRLRRQEAIQNSATTGTWTECLFRNHSDYSAVASYTTESSTTSLLAGGGNIQPVIPALFFDQVPFRTISIVARGIIACTGTPTYTFNIRLGATSGSTYIAGTLVGQSAAISCTGTLANKVWELRYDLTCNTSGIGTGNATLSGGGFVSSPGIFASPFTYALTAGTGDSATWTSTFDDSVTQYINLTMACSASSSSNTMTCKYLAVQGLN